MFVTGGGVKEKDPHFSKIHLAKLSIKFKLRTMVSCKHFLVEGHVQGVGFRAFVLREAKKFQLYGWVRNLTDGRVEILVQGSVDLLDQIKILLWQGPSFARVESIKEKNLTYQEDLRSFIIEIDGDAPCQFE